MKVTFSAEYKRLFTLEEYHIAKQIVKDMKNDESTAEEYARSAVNAIGRAYDIGSCSVVYSCSAVVSKNSRVYDYYSDGSGALDIWLEGVARTDEGFLDFGAYLSDIWSLSDENAAEIARYHMYSSIYKKA